MTDLPADFTTCHKLPDGRLASRTREADGSWGWVAFKPHTPSRYGERLTDAALQALMAA